MTIIEVKGTLWNLYKYCKLSGNNTQSTCIYKRNVSYNVLYGWTRRTDRFDFEFNYSNSPRKEKSDRKREKGFRN